MQLYQSHKKVRAAQIVRLDGDTKIMFEEGVTPIMVSLAFIERHKPKPGDYLVEYEDGYLSVSPAAAFEGGYAAIDEDGQTIEQPEAEQPDTPAPAPIAMRAKMRINSIDGKYPGYEMMSFNAVSKSEAYPEDGYDENNTYAKFSPSGSLSLTVANPNLLGKFKEGEEYYLDFTKAKDAPAPVEPPAPAPTGDDQSA